MKSEQGRILRIGIGLVVLLTACGNRTAEVEEQEVVPSTTEASMGEEITVVTREENSGTRDAFEEIVNIETMYEGAIVQQGTEGVLDTVANDIGAIGYTSIGALSDEVKALRVHDTEPTIENIQQGEYEIYRNFNLAYANELSEVAQDFWTFIFSAEGQEVVEESGYIPVDLSAPAYDQVEHYSGSITIVGSTSVYPSIVALSEAYNQYQPNVQFDIQSTGSGAGVAVAIDGTADIGMASRDLTNEEVSQVSHVQPMALDGIAVIVHPNNPIENLSVEETTKIFSGELVKWTAIGEND
jgi:phosphate transport system substrate-binding protein